MKKTSLLIVALMLVMTIFVVAACETVPTKESGTNSSTDTPTSASTGQENDDEKNANEFFASVQFAQSVEESFTLPSNENVTWSVSEGGQAAEIDGNTLVVTQWADDVSVTLTATYKKDGNTFTRNYTFVVKAEAEPTLTGVQVGGDAEAQFAFNAETGMYEGKFTLTTQWQFVHFDLAYSNQSTVRLTYTNTTFTGDGIASEKAAGATLSAVLFADTDDQVANGLFCFSIADEKQYVVTYDPETYTMTVNVYVPDAEGEIIGVKVGGDANAELALNTETGKYEGRFTLTAQWQLVHFNLMYKDDVTVRLTFANTTFEGTGIHHGTYWFTGTAVLYADSEAMANEGRFCYGKPDGATEYVVTYDPEKNIMTVDVYVPESTAEVVGVSVAGAAEAQFTLNTETKKYEAKFTLDTQWQFVHFVLTYNDDSTVRMTYSNTAFTGSGIKSEKASGATMTAVLFADTDAQILDGLFCYSIGDITEYTASYDPATKTMTVDVVVPEPTADLSGVSVGGAAEAQFTLNTETKKYEAKFTLTAQWQFIHFDLAFSDSSTLRLTYSNTTFTGTGIRSAAYWYTGEGILYGDGDHVAAGEFCYDFPSGSTEYVAIYDPETKTMTVNFYVSAN